MGPGGQYGITTQGNTERCIASTFLHQDIVPVKTVTFEQGQDTLTHKEGSKCNACHDCERGESNPGRLDH